MRRTLLAVGGVVAILALAAAIATGRDRVPKGYLGMSLPPDFSAFASDSPWNTPIPPDAGIDPDSALIVDALRVNCPPLKADYARWTIPLFVIKAEDCPNVQVQTTSDALNPGVDPDGDGVAVDIPIPSGVWPDPAEDGHMLLVDPVLRKSWDFSCAKRLSSKRWQASRLDIWDLDGPGYRNAFEGDYWWTYGARGSGMPLVAGLVRPEEIQAGVIRHALVFASPINRKSATIGGPTELFCPPASRTDGQGIGHEFIPEGARLQLDPDLDLESLGLSQPAKVVARALQEYGMYNGDNSETFKLYFQNLGPDGEEWRSLFEFDDLNKIPVVRFRVIEGRKAYRD
ncbi:hypothetical protein JW916_09385 [Candidatus Sumerlaeota bacterium]|nr:hypothetical protein [Candidatus Sumerlaeota bacterium]